MFGNQLQLRKAEIERLSSPEQLDTAMRVTSPKGWVALLGLGAVIIAAVAWSIWGRLSEKVDGTGMIMRGAVQTVQAPNAGRVAEIKVSVGDLITTGQEIARLELSENEVADLQSQIEASRARINDLSTEKRQYESRMGRVRSSYRVQLQGLRSQLKTKKDLRRRGLAREQDVLAIEGQIAGIEAQIAQNETSESSLEVDLNEEKRKLKQLTDKQERSDTIVTATSNGKVASILIAKDDLIDAGARLINIESTREEPFNILLFVPFAEGKKVQPKMVVRIAPTTVRPEEYGYILGEVVTVSSLPVNPEEVRTTLNNDQLARKFAEDTPFKVQARPVLDDTGRFQWTSAKGETLTIESNTPCSAQVVTGDRAPISYVIPKVKEMLGLS